MSGSKVEVIWECNQEGTYQVDWSTTMFCILTGQCLMDVHFIVQKKKANTFVLCTSIIYLFHK